MNEPLRWKQQSELMMDMRSAASIAVLAFGIT
ncbi:hypothetical protein V474_07415 [Novosphingobium barchaimii LL02]|uniref:Uncharacterized protein n=1 Tax=Novosphingobium barchaimii LL02 TaxID=1114963 RepID=A0A0J8B0M3_9SPHN|nr:hypothetical protein V474_07415 [Novosphingobium barchaimii LL02]